MLSHHTNCPNNMLIFRTAIILQQVQFLQLGHKGTHLYHQMQKHVYETYRLKSDTRPTHVKSEIHYLFAQAYHTESLNISRCTMNLCITVNFCSS